MCTYHVEPSVGQGFSSNVEGIDRRVVFGDEEFVVFFYLSEWQTRVELSIASLEQFILDVLYGEEIDGRGVEEMEESVDHRLKYLLIGKSFSLLIDKGNVFW